MDSFKNGEILDLLDVYSCQYREKVGWHSFSPALTLNIIDIEKFEVGKRLTGWGKKLTGYFFSPTKKKH